MRAKALALGYVAALSITSGAAHAAGPTQAELNNAVNGSANCSTWITTITANATRRSTKSPRRTPRI